MPARASAPPVSTTRVNVSTEGKCVNCCWAWIDSSRKPALAEQAVQGVGLLRARTAEPRSERLRLRRAARTAVTIARFPALRSMGPQIDAPARPPAPGRGASRLILHRGPRSTGAPADRPPRQMNRPRTAARGRSPRATRRPGRASWRRPAYWYSGPGRPPARCCRPSPRRGAPPRRVPHATSSSRSPRRGPTRSQNRLHPVGEHRRHHVALVHLARRCWLTSPPTRS